MANMCFNSLSLESPSEALKSYLLELVNECTEVAKKQEGIQVDGVDDKVIFDLSTNCDDHFTYETKWATSIDFSKRIATLFPQESFEITFEEFGSRHAGMIRSKNGQVAVYFVKESFWDVLNEHDKTGSNAELPSIEEHLDNQPKSQTNW